MVINGNPTSMALTLGIGALIVWRVYSRIRRMVGRQVFRPRRPWLTVVLFPLLIAMLLLASLAHPWNALALAGGVAAGAGLGVYGLRLTRFEATPAGRFYTPNAHLGIALSLLFVARVAYRVVELYLAAETPAAPHVEFARSPLTLVIFGTLAGYYVAYAIGLLRWRARVREAAPPAPPLV